LEHQKLACWAVVLTRDQLRLMLLALFPYRPVLQKFILLAKVGLATRAILVHPGIRVPAETPEQGALVGMVLGVRLLERPIAYL
jgi:hypothetical protein